MLKNRSLKAVNSAPIVQQWKGQGLVGSRHLRALVSLSPTPLRRQKHLFTDVAGTPNLVHTLFPPRPRLYLQGAVETALGSRAHLPKKFCRSFGRYHVTV